MGFRATMHSCMDLQLYHLRDGSYSDYRAVDGAFWWCALWQCWWISFSLGFKYFGLWKELDGTTAPDQTSSSPSMVGNNLFPHKEIGEKERKVERIKKYLYRGNSD